ncbi:unnamed protein product, partial [marine sediment metagenome]
YGQLGEEEAEHLARSQEIIELWEDGTYVINEQTGALEHYTEATQKLTEEQQQSQPRQLSWQCQ